MSTFTAVPSIILSDIYIHFNRKTILKIIFCYNMSFCIVSDIWYYIGFCYVCKKIK